MSVSPVSSSMPAPEVSPGTPSAQDVSAQKKQDLSTEVAVSVQKLIQHEEQILAKGVLDMLM